MLIAAELVTGHHYLEQAAQWLSHKVEAEKASRAFQYRRLGIRVYRDADMSCAGETSMAIGSGVPSRQSMLRDLLAEVRSRTRT